MTTTLTRPRNAWQLEPAQAERADAEDLLTHIGESRPDIVDVWGRDSFPASDPPANW